MALGVPGPALCLNAPRNPDFPSKIPQSLAYINHIRIHFLISLAALGAPGASPPPSASGPGVPCPPGARKNTSHPLWDGGEQVDIK